MALVLHEGLKTHHQDYREMSLDDFEYKLNMRYMAYYAHCVAVAMNAVQPDMSEVTRVLGEIESMKDEVEEEQSPLILTDPPISIS